VGCTRKCTFEEGPNETAVFVHWKSHKGMCQQFPRRSGVLPSEVATSQATCELGFMMDSLSTSFSVKSEMSNFLTACTYLPEPSPMQERKYSNMIHRHLANGQQQMMNRPCEKNQQFSILVHREVFIRQQSNVMQTQVVRHSLRRNVLAATLNYNVQLHHFIRRRE
jgi:hypothetical protein